MYFKAPKTERTGKALTAWLDEEQMRALDERAAELQAGRSLRVTRTDVLREILDTWIESRRRPAEGPAEPIADAPEEGDAPSGG